MTVSDLICYELTPNTRLFAAETGPALTYGYCLTDELSHTAILIDAPQFVDKIYENLCERHGYKVSAILLTHTHWDHTFSATALKRIFHAPIYVHAADNYRLADPNGNTVWPLPFDLEPSEADFFLENKSILTFGSHNLETRHTPGHTEGGVCFVEHSLGIVFSGDTLFASSIGRTDLPGGNLDQLLDSIKRELMTLPDDMQVFAGHGDPTVIGAERLGNPFLR